MLAPDAPLTGDKPIESAEQLSSIAFSFMASKALFAGLHVDLFSLLAEGPKSAEELAKAADIPLNRIVTLTTALASVGLLAIGDDKKFTILPRRRTFCPSSRSTISATTFAIRSTSRCIRSCSSSTP